MNLQRLLPALVLTLFIATLAIAQDDASKPSASPAFDFLALVRDGLLDPATPVGHRQELADQAIEAAEREKSASLFYVLGTLYRQGNANGIAPFPQDIDRARDYLTRSAVGGYLDAMNKLALLELDSGDRFRANLWAQLYVHYSPMGDPATAANPNAPRKATNKDNEAANLLELTLEGFPKSDIPRLVKRANEMVARYDDAIRAYLKEQIAEVQKTSFPKTSEKTATFLKASQVLDQLGRDTKTANAQFFVEFANDGSLLRVWPFDAWPDDKALRALRPVINGYVLDPAPAETTETRVVVIPVLFVNPNYRPKPANDKE